MALSNDELLSWFCVTNPVPELTPDRVAVLPRPGHSRYRKPPEENRHDEPQSPVDPSPPVAGRGAPVGGRYYERLYNLHQSMEDHQEPRVYNVGIDEEVEDEEEYFAGREVNPNAKPGDDDYQVGTTSSIYDNYSFSENTNIELPISAYRERVVQTIEANSVTVIQGSTGSGKTTQVPQYILDHYANERRHCNIICTQPRRIAATSIAKFVADSRKWRLGGLVGYQIGMNRMLSEDTRLTFATTGILLQKLINMKNMNQYTHVILDEVHERDQDTDFCLLVVRKLLRTNSKHVKVILMSATIESSSYAQYFATKIAGRLEPAPIVDVEGRSYHVNEFYLDDLRHIGVCEPTDVENPRLMDDTKDLACKLIEEFDRIEQAKARYDRDFVRGSVLMFLPGLPEIQDMTHKLSDCGHLGLYVIQLHSSISVDDQRKVFFKPEGGRRKVIVATNIAESSITVPDIKYVIDFCLVKEMTCDQQTNYECLKLHWASKASLAQRMGRAGRVSAGRCYRLITRDFFRRFIPPYSTPEMQRCSLEKLVLHAKQLDLGDPKSILGLALEPPNLAGIESAIISLKEVGALSVLHRGRFIPYDGDITFLGQVLASLPVDVRLGKLLVLGHAFGCLEECLVIAAALSQKSIFMKPFAAELTGYSSKISWSDGSFSDCIAILNAYKEWFRLRDSGQFRSEGIAERNWCARNKIHRNVINAVSDVVKELSGRLVKFNVSSFRRIVSRHNEGDLHEMLILKMVLCGAFYPNYFKWGECDEEVNQKMMSGHDPTTTVMLNGLPPGSENYSQTICDMFRSCDRRCESGKFLHFEGSKVYVEFERPRPSRTLPVGTPVQPVLEAVYIALKRGRMREPLRLCVFKESTSSEQLVSWEGRMTRQESFERLSASSASLHSPEEPKSVKLPRSGHQQIVVTEVVDAAHFWAQFNDIATSSNLELLMDTIRDHLVQRRLTPLTSRYLPQQLKGVFCLAMFHEDKQYYRARIERLDESNCMARVVFVDYGNVEWVPLDYTCELPEVISGLPMQAFECHLRGVKPSYRSSPNGRWSMDAIIRFKELIREKPLVAMIYSEVEGVLRVDLYDTVTYNDKDIFINEVLVEEGYAMACDEPYQSRLAHSQSLLEEQARGQESSGRPALPITPGVLLASTNCSSVEWGRPNTLPVPDQRGTRGKRTITYALRGPTNPYEVKFYAMTSIGSMRPARIQQDSVNSIVVDNEPQDKHQRLMVAANVALNPSGSTCVARETTLLPNIHGLPYIVCLLFAPMVEMRCDDLKRQYIGAICGLGFDHATGESLYPEHDIELTFDTLITRSDLEEINKVRFAMNLAMSANEDGVADWGEHAIKRIQTRARECLTDLILKTRDSVPPHHFTGSGWNQVAPRDVLLADQGDLEEGRPPLFPMHKGIDISGERIDQQRSTRVLILREKMRELRKKASGSQRPEMLMCDLCNTRCSTPRELLLHLGSRLHRIEEQRLFQDDCSLDLTDTDKQLSDLKV